MYEVEAILEKAELTEFECPASGPYPRVNKWCQSGAQAGWGPDIDEVRVTVEASGGNFIEIDNDIYSPRVAFITKKLRELKNTTVLLSFEPVTEEELHDIGLSQKLLDESIAEYEAYRRDARENADARR